MYVDCIKCFDHVLLYPCCVVMCRMLSIMYGKSVFSSVLASLDSREIGLYEVPMLSCLVLG